MLCEKCKKNPATVHMVQVINGVKSEQHLCAECAATQHNMNMAKESIADFFPFFGKMPQVRKSSFEPCPVCGSSFEEIQQSGLMGCDKCYEHFKPYIMQVLPRIQKGSEHRGKLPAGEKAELAKGRELENLRTQLAKCIMAEDFEQAAVLRDKIRALEGGER